MEGLIRDGVGDLAGFASGHLSSALAAGDAHFFEDIPSSPAKIRELLESNQVRICVNVSSSIRLYLFSCMRSC